MGEGKVEKIDKWLSKILPPQDPPKRDLLDAMEPVYATESGSFEEVSYDVPFLKDDASAESLQRSATKFKTRAPAPKLTKRVLIKKPLKNEDRVTYATRLLKNYLATQKFIELRPNYHVFVQEYLERHINEMPFRDASFVKQLRQEIFEKATTTISTHRHVEISGGREKPESYRCLVIIPIDVIGFLQGGMSLRNILTTLLIHEIEGHCRDMNPASAFWRLMRNVGLVKSAVRTSDVSWQDPLRPYLELSAQIENVDFVMKKLQFAKKPNVIPKFLRDQFLALVGKCASEVLLELSSMDLKKRDLISGFFKERMRRASKDTRVYFRKILQEKYYFNDKVISLIGL